MEHRMSLGVSSVYRSNSEAPQLHTAGVLHLRFDVAHTDGDQQVVSSQYHEEHQLNK